MVPEASTGSASTAREERGPGEAAWLQSLCEGDPSAIGALVRAHYGALVAVTRRILLDEADARDAVEAAFLQAFRSIGQLEGRSGLSAWLRRIAIEVALLRLRATRRPEEPIEPLLPRFTEEGEHAAPVGDWSDAAETALLRAEARQRLRAAVDRLPAPYRVALVLRDVEGLDAEETARVLGLTRDVVERRLHHARPALRTLLAELFAR
jgi:RNA polymerase sigma-70 factor (ECF subfamily)